VSAPTPADLVAELRDVQLTQEEADELDAIRSRPSSIEGKTFKRVPSMPSQRLGNEGE